MDKLDQISCSSENHELLSYEHILALGIAPGDIYASIQNITRLALCAGQERGFLLLPFCHTVEAKALGADITPADETAGPRPGEYRLSSPDALPLLEIPTHPDAARLLKACAQLTQQGHCVTYQLSGPISILSCLMSLSKLFQFWRKNPHRMPQQLAQLQDMLLGFAAALCDTGISCLTYADPAGCPDILGPKQTAILTEYFTLPFLRRLVAICGTRCNLLICPLTATTLFQTGHLQVVSEGLGQFTACCVKQSGTNIKRNIILH